MVMEGLLKMAGQTHAQGQGKQITPNTMKEGFVDEQR
jgi:hypothetical protein